MSKRIECEIVIDASPAEVWDVIFDREGAPRWSNFLLGYALDGDRAEVDFMMGKRPAHRIAQATTYVEGRMFGWCGPMTPGFLGADNHIFELKQLPDGRTSLRQSDDVSGIAQFLASDKPYRQYNADLAAEVARRKRTRK